MIEHLWTRILWRCTSQIRSDLAAGSSTSFAPTIAPEMPAFFWIACTTSQRALFRRRANRVSRIRHTRQDRNNAHWPRQRRQRHAQNPNHDQLDQNRRNLKKTMVRVGGACGPPPPVVARKLALLPAASPRLTSRHALSADRGLGLRLRRGTRH